MRIISMTALLWTIALYTSGVFAHAGRPTGPPTRVFLRVGVGPTGGPLDKSLVRPSSGVFAQPAKSVNDAVYTAAQAERGTAVFNKVCASCHETSRFTGNEFLPVWVGKSLFELYDVVHATMPEDKPGSLTPQQYVDVIAYFLKLNSYPAGSTELPGDDAALKGIRFDKKSK